MSAPELSRHDLETQVKRLLDAGRKRFLMAFHGSGKDDELDVDGTRVRVLSVRSELDLRRRLLGIGKDEHAAFLIPWRAASLPVDLQGRFARDGRIQTVGREERLKARFGVTEVDDEARDCPLAEYILSHHPTEAFGNVGGRLTLDALWTAWLARVWGFDGGGELALDALLGWAAIDARGPQFVATLREHKADAVRGALLDHLGKRLGPMGPVAWTAWESDRGTAMLELGLVLGAVAGANDAGVKVWARFTARTVFDRDVDERALAQLAETADAGLRFLARPGRSSPSAVRAIVLAADQRAAEPEVAPHVIGSSRLPSAFRARVARLGRALGELAAAPSATALQAAVAIKGEVWRHDMAQAPDQIPLLRQIDMALRLASWLVARTDRDVKPSVTPYDDVENLATWYASEGGYLDRARRWARGGEGELKEGIAAIVRAVDTIRTELDQRFARALPAWHAAGRRATEVVPIDQALKRIGAEFLDGDPARKLLVILMDGMAWAQAVELLESMGNRSSVWGPLAWHSMSRHRIGEGPFPAVLTTFPTVTEVSRSAFFGGKPIAAGAATNASTDPDRWKTNRDVLKYVTGNVVPRLHLRGDGQHRDGSATDDALQLVLDPQQRIVGVVINAIDMSLKADRTHEVEWKLDTVKALRELLDKAAEAGRAVLLCSDHGHVPADRFGTGEPARDAARWRTWQTASEPLAAFEVGLPASDGVWAPRGAHGVALIADDAHRHGGGTGAGEHGGASLAEVVAPCVLIGCADVVAATDDLGQAVQPIKAPPWWFFEVGAATEIAPEPKKPRKTTKKVTPASQVYLPSFTPPPVTVVEAAAPSSALASSELFQARATNPATREQALKAVELLRARRGVVAADAFAAELGEFASRVQGLVAKLTEVLNVDGYVVLRYDRANREVHLDLEKLKAQFDL